MRTLFLAFLFLAACSSFDPPGMAEGRVLSMGASKPGYGQVVSVGVLPGRGSNASTSAAGGTVPDPNAYRLSLHMANGGFQTVDVDNGTFMAGEEVEVTSDGRVVRVSGTSLNNLRK